MSDWSSDVCSSDLQVGQSRIAEAQLDRRIAVGLGDRLGQRQAAEVQTALQPAGGRGRIDLAHINTHGTGAVARLFAGLQLPAVGLAGNFYAAFQQGDRSEEHTSELQSLMRISYAVFCLKKQKQIKTKNTKKKL